MRRFSSASECFGYDMRDRDGAEPGELLVAFDEKNEASQSILRTAFDAGANLGLRYGAGSYDESDDARGYAQLHRLFVDQGAEDAAVELISGLRDHADFSSPSGSGGYGRLALAVGPNYRIGLSGRPAATRRRTVSVTDYQFGDAYPSYRAMVQTAPWTSGGPRRVAIVDSGIAPDWARAGWHLGRATNFVDRAAAADDDNGHGTAVAHIIADLLPNVVFDNVKIMDSDGSGSEWSLLRGLMACGGADVINLSLDYKIHDYRCPRCRVWSPEYRSDAFDFVIGSILDRHPNTVIVAAAGNDGKPQLAYPARFGDVVAVGSINSRGELSRHSNFGTADNTGQPHRAHFVMPGGEDRPGAREDVIRSPHLGGGWGTSLATAFASAAAAELHGRNPGYATRDGVVDELRASASQSAIRYYSPERYGNGFIRI